MSLIELNVSLSILSSVWLLEKCWQTKELNFSAIVMMNSYFDKLIKF